MDKSRKFKRISSGKKKKAPSRWSSGICGVWVNMITQDHAKVHGFMNADEMAKDGIVKSNNKIG